MFHQHIPDDAILKREIAAASLSLSLLRLELLLLKGTFDENQPRVPRGNRDGGQWTDGAGGSSSGNGQRQQSRQRFAQGKPRKPLLPEGDPSKPPKLPRNKPTKPGFTKAYAKQLAMWLGKKVVKKQPYIGAALTIYDNRHWIHDEVSSIISSFDDPKPLAELHDLVKSPKRGYEIHHIVEQTAAKKAGFPKSKINSRENLARIPTWKHHEITGWYARGNREFDGKSPREHLHDKSWEERLKVGHKIMIEKGVLKP